MMRTNEVAFDKQQRIIAVKKKTCENTRILPLMEDARIEQKKTEIPRKILSTNVVVSEKNDSEKLQRISSKRRQILKDDTLNNDLYLVEKSSCLHSTTVKRSSQDSKYSFGNTKVVTFEINQKIKPHFSGNASSPFSRFVVTALPSDKKNSLTNVKSGGNLTAGGKEAYGSKILHKTSSTKCGNSSRILADVSRIPVKHQEIFSRFHAEEKMRRHSASDRTAKMDSKKDEGKPFPSLKKPSFYLTGLGSQSEEEILYQNKKKEHKVNSDIGRQEKESKSLLNLERLTCHRNSGEDAFKLLTKKDFSLDVKTLLNYRPSGSTSAKDLEVGRAILSEPEMKISGCPEKVIALREKAFQSSSRRSHESKKPVSLPPSPVKRVRLRMKHRQDNFMNQREENSELNEEEGRILPTILSEWKGNCYSVMTPYMAKVVWSVMEDELKD